VEEDAAPMKSVGIVAYTDYQTDARVTRHAEAACRAGYAVDVFTPSGGGQRGRQAANGVSVLRLRGRYYRGSAKLLYLLSYANFLVRCLVRITRIHLRSPYRVIQVCNMPDVLVFSAALAKLMGAKIVLDIHDPMPRTYLAKFPDSAGKVSVRLILWLEKLSAAFADRVMTVHEPVKRDILLKDGIPPEKVSVVANFPDEEIFRVQAPYEIGLPVRMVYYGTISARFGLEDVLSAIAGVRGRDRLFFKIIGKGDGGAALQGRIGQLGLGATVEFDNTSYPLRRLPGIIGRFQLGLVPYRPSAATDYMLPVKLMELLAMGIPAITVPNTAIRHYLDGGLYFAYDPGDMGSLTRLLDRILDDPALLLRKREAVLAASNRYVWKTELPKYLETLAQLST